jgi:hypothetical protein
MNCHQFDKIIVNLACEQLTDAAKRRDALAHAQSCAQCGTRLARQQSVADGLRALALQEQAINAPAQLGAALQAAFERQRTVSVQEHFSPVRAGQRSLSWLNWRWAAAAAVLLVVFGLAAASWWRARSQVAPPTVETITRVIKEQSPKTPSGLEVDVAANASPMPVKLRPQLRKKSERRRTDDYGALISLMPIAPTETEEFQQVVRMQIPRSTLRLWGLPLNDESNSGPVNAEVYFSENGVARAIRLHN